jgi:hypothetical protein
MTPASSPQTGPAGTIFRSRGVFYFPGRVRCPLAGVGGRGDHDSNRLVLDGGETEVTIDRTAARITVHDAQRYAGRVVVCDLAFLAEGLTATGRRTPFCVHLKIMKSNDRFSLDLHRHLRTQEPLVAVEIEPFEVVVTDGVRARVVLDARRVERLACRPSLALRLLKSIMTMRDHRGETAAAETTPEGSPMADLSLGFGALGLRWMMARARLTSPNARDSALFPTGSVAELLAGGAWTLRLTALSRHWLPEVVKRDLFLFGLDHLPLLDGVKARGLRKGESLQFGFDGGRGEVVLGDQRAPLPGALDVARAYLEFHMLGGLLCEQVESERTTAATAVDVA